MQSKPILLSTKLKCLGLTLGVALLGGLSAFAHPYASGVTNDAGTIRFFLNENADNVKVIFDGNAATNDLGALTRGPASFSLAGHTSYAIVVTKAGSGVPNQISPTPVAGNSSTNLAFNGPRGVAVNKNAKSPFFGRIYVSNASAGNDRRPVGRGIYVINPDYSDALGYGTNAAPPQSAFPAGGSQWWGSSTTYGPYRLWVGSDDTLYVADNSGTGTTIAGCPVWMIDPNVTTPVEMFAYSGANLGNSGNAGPCHTEPVITGSLGTGDLKLTCMMWNYAAPGAGYQGLLRYNIGAGPIDASTVWSGTPDIIVTNTQPGFGSAGVNGVLEDIYINPTNSFVYVAMNRSSSGGITNGNNQIWVFDCSTNTGNLDKNNPECVWASSGLRPGDGGTITSGVTRDCFQLANVQPSGIAISPDGQYLAMGNMLAANFCIVKLTNGIPDKSTIVTYAAPGIINRTVTFDQANNLYTVEGNSDSLRVYSLGLTTTCITSNDASGANGSFAMILPPSTVSVTATTPNASQGNPTPVAGVFTITRAGQLTSPLYVTYTLGGTASNSTYNVSGGTRTNVTLAVGQASTNIIITPVNDGIARLTTSATLNLSSGTNYSAVSPVSATVFIQNTAEPQLVLNAAAATAYKRFTNDYASISITRMGNTNTSFTLSTLNLGGTAVLGTDFSTYPAPSFNNGEITKTFRILQPLNPAELTYAGSKSVVVTVGNNGSTYIGLPGNSQTLTILDDAYPTSPVLWFDPLTNTAVANPGSYDDGYGQWNVAAVNRDASDPYGGGDFTIDWGYDLVNDPFGYGLIPLPPNGATSALRITYNKAHGIAGGVNLYPTNVTFGGDYAFRFSVYLGQGGALGSATEGPLFGINHDGMETNWWLGAGALFGGPWSSDGVWYWLDSDTGGATFGDYVEFTGITDGIPNTGWAKLGALFGGTSFVNVFKDPDIYTTVGATTNAAPGMPANASPNVLPGRQATNNWADVEVKQVNNIVTMTINKTTIFTYPNTNATFRAGTIMLGYEDPFDSLGNPDAAAYFSNLRVVRLASPVITATTLNGGNIKIAFTSNDGDDTTASFVVQSSSTVNGVYTDVTPAATITQDPASAIFTATAAQNGPVQFYRIRHK